MKSLWKERSQKVWSFFCPQCKIPRRIPYRSNPGGVKQYSQIALTAIVFTLACWPWFGPKGLVSFLPIWIIFETFYRSKVRAALNCEQCGFDPVLYLSDIKAARREIEDHWKRKFAEKGIPYPDKNQIATQTLNDSIKDSAVAKSEAQASRQSSNSIVAKTRLDDPVPER